MRSIVNGSVRRFLGAAIVAALAWCLDGDALHAQSAWPMYQGDASHSGFLPIAIDPSKIALKWEQAIPGGFPLNPVTAAEGKVFVSQSSYFGSAGLFALDKETGATLWSQTFGAPFSVNPPAWDNGRVYLQTCDNANDTWFWSFDASSGQIKFKTPTSAQWEHYFAPTLVGGVAYLDGGTYGGLYAIDATTGAQLWWKGLPQYDQWTPAVDAQHAYAYVGEYSPALYVFDRLTGQPAYTIPDPDFSWDGWSMNLAPVLGGEQDVLATHNNRLISFDLSGHSIRWQKSDHFAGQPAVSGGVIYVLDAGSLQARDELTGNLLWNWVPGIDVLTGAVVVTASHALVQSATKTYLVNLATHASDWSWPKSGFVSIAQSTIYIARADGTLTALQYQASPLVVALEPSKTKFTSSPPQVTVHGAGFAAAANPHVQFGGQEAKNVVVVDDQTITCTAPRGLPGKVDVTVLNDNGTGQLAGGFAYTPLMEASGSYEPGGTVTLTFEDEPFDTIWGVWGWPFGTVTPTPKYGGAPILSALHPLFIVPHWPFATLSLTLDIPASAPLPLPVVGVQALMGANIPAGDADWTNGIILGN